MIRSDIWHITRSDDKSGQPVSVRRRDRRKRRVIPCFLFANYIQVHLESLCADVGEFIQHHDIPLSRYFHCLMLLEEADRALGVGLALLRDHSRDAVAGTLSFMAPEQFVGKELGTYSDLYALGCVAWGPDPFAVELG